MAVEGWEGGFVQMIVGVMAGKEGLGIDAGGRAKTPEWRVQDESGHGRVLLSVKEARRSAHAAPPEADFRALTCGNGRRMREQ